MSDDSTLPWPEANDRYLTAAVDVVRSTLEWHAANLAGEETKDRVNAAIEALDQTRAAMPAPPALDQLGATFDLSPFERGVLLLAAGMEVDAGFAALCAKAQHDAERNYPTFRLALDALPGAHWSALSPAASLRRWQLIEIGPGDALTSSPLRVAERVLHFLFGVDHPSERLAGIVEPVPPPDAELAPAHRQLARRIAALWAAAGDHSALPVVQLCGGEPAEKRAIAAAASELCGCRLQAMLAHALPTKPHEIDALKRLWECEAALGGSMLLLDCDELRTADGERQEAVAWFLERTLGGIIISTQERRRARQRTMVSYDVEKPPAAEQRDLWQAALKDVDFGAAAGAGPNGDVEPLVCQFDLGAPAIEAALADAMAQLAASGESAGDREAQEAGAKPVADLATALWDACRLQARPRLDDLAQRIEPVATWLDLVLPERQRQALRTVASHVRQRLAVYEGWGFASKGKRGLGISALFAGASGTGKTMAAEALAGELRLDLYCIDLSAVVSKYIGETEKNLSRIFAAAEAGGAILLFDEADALFGKRSEVKDSHDRHANIEVSYLLQRMEAYRGLAILTTNMKDALDDAFLRRLRFIVEFPFPNVDQRAEIWRRIFPEATPTAGLDRGKLARLNVAGGSIRNIAMNAAFLASADGVPVAMRHLLTAARDEYEKTGKRLFEAEVRGW